ncbi:hypothetical protein B0H14DRAFT_3101988 [Mycena olivaceomarginata]|nr:hypothetical protein B0H14DRAFT_3101988 [Mycena olivaceomarginata]
MPLHFLKGRIFAVLAGQPRDPSYKTSVAAAFGAIMQEGTAARFPAIMRKHRRGLFAVINVGLTFGKGAKVPSWLMPTDYTAMTDSAFALWAPRLHEYYRTQDTKLRQHLPHLPRIFPHSIFSCAAFNFGPKVWTFRHRDVQNVPFGWCAIQSAGNFDATKGGHPRLFPAGALILLPSATITHSNIPVQEGDTRTSFTQFTAGALMRYVDNGFRRIRKSLRVSKESRTVGGRWDWDFLAPWMS